MTREESDINHHNMLEHGRCRRLSSRMLSVPLPLSPCVSIAFLLNEVSEKKVRTLKRSFRNLPPKFGPIFLVLSWQVEKSALKMSPDFSHQRFHNSQGEQTCTELWLPFCVAFAPFSRRGMCPCPVLQNPLFLWEVLLFLQNLQHKSTVFPTRKYIRGFEKGLAADRAPNAAKKVPQN